MAEPQYSLFAECHQAKTLRDHPCMYSPSLSRWFQDDEGDLDEEEAWAKYLKDVRDTAAWGGQLELQALAKALEKTITVLSAGMPAVVLGEEYEGEGVTVCYLRHAYGLGEHYNSVAPLAGKGRAQEEEEDGDEEEER